MKFKLIRTIAVCLTALLADSCSVETQKEKVFPLKVFKDQPEAPLKGSIRTTWDKTFFGPTGPMLKADTKRDIATLKDVPIKMPVYQYWAPDGYWVWSMDGERVILAVRCITLPQQAGTIYKVGYYPTPPPRAPHR